MKDTLADEWGKMQNLRNNFYPDHDTACKMIFFNFSNGLPKPEQSR